MRPRFLGGHVAQTDEKVELFLLLNNYASSKKDVRGRCTVVFTYRPLYLRGTGSDNHCIQGWVRPRANLDTVVKRKIS
jgi:hypothetical protein